MKILIVGAGASGIVAAINLKRNNPNFEVTIIEQLDKPLKKILATGNGKCNLANANIDFNLFNDAVFSKQTIAGYDYEEFFDSISIKTKKIGDLVYPVSESAVSVREALLNECKKLHIKINVSEKLLDYKIGNKITVITDKNNYVVDKLILSGGLKSSPKLGSDGSVIKILENHGYEIESLNPGLSPLLTKEKTKEIDGTRCKCNAKLLCKNKLIHEESGEVLFKDHGLSGIVIFNTMSIISRVKKNDLEITLDLLPDYTNEYLTEYLKNHTIDELLLAFINPKISVYLKNRFKTEKEILDSLKNLKFTPDKSYGFEFSQVTVGGIKVHQINEFMMSKKENNVYIIGELLNIDGPCGGYNLTFAIASGMKVR